MPSKLKRPCNYPMCPQLTNDRYCEAHRKQVAKRYDERRGTAAQRGYSGRWQRYRIIFLQRNPLCAECQRQGRLTPAKHVDHIIPHKGDMELFWDVNNWQSLCVHHHSQKSTKEGGFGL